MNPEYERLGDGYYTPDIILTTWFQAESGAVPVSGCGYGGPFSGKGFDSMWTDMSEIVRPTRDGIHGREYINTGVDIGRKLPRLHFDGMNYTDMPPPILQSPLPLMFDAVAPHWRHPNVVSAINTAAGELGLFSIVPAGEDAPHSSEKRNTIVPLIEDAEKTTVPNTDAPMIIVQDSQKIIDTVAGLKKENAKRIVGVRLPAGGEAAARVVLLARQGIEVVNIVFDKHGMEPATQKPRHMRDGLREVHKALVKEGIRDEVTLIASGGIALPEHMAKAIICGADLVTVDIPLILAMDCRLCGECERGEQCQVGLADIDAKYAAQRVINLMGSWHSQLLEMLGAMGIREARRLRGEVGRCMFFEDLEAAAFGRIFGKRKEIN